MSQLDPAKNEVSPDQLYFDITVSNFKSTTTKPPQFYFNESRTLPFVRNPEDYYLSILRFTVETGSLPVFIPSIEPSQADRDKTIYSFTLEYTDPSTGTTFSSGQEFINYIPQRSPNSAPLPPPPNQTANGLQNNNTGYYYIYNYQWLISLMNITLETAFANLKANIAIGGGTPIANDVFAPFFNWDTTSNSAVLYADFSVFGTNGTAGANPYKIYMNAPLFALFPTFPVKYLGYEGVVDGKNYLFEPRNNGSSDLDTITPEPPTTPLNYRAVKVYQECSTIANLSPITALVFTSNTLPIQPNQVSTPLVYNNSQELVLGGSNSDFANIITDLVSDTGQYKPNLVYNPTSEYRLITLYGNRPLSNIDIQVFWRDKFGKLNPFRLASGEAITIKVAFLKKGSYKQMV